MVDKTDRTPTGDEVAAKAAEAASIRKQLEALADQGLFDLSKKEIRDAHTRLDALERFVHVARRRSTP